MNLIHSLPHTFPITTPQNIFISQSSFLIHYHSNHQIILHKHYSLPIHKSYTFYDSITLQSLHSTIIWKTHLLQNSKILQIHNLPTQLLINRLCNKLNSNPILYININPVNASLLFKSIQFFNPSNTIKQLIKNIQFMQNIRTNILLSMTTKLLNILQYQSPTLQSKLLKLIINHHLLSHLQFQCQKINPNDHSTTFLSHSNILNQQLNKNRLLQPKYILSQSQILNQIPLYLKYLNQMIPRYLNPRDKSSIFNQIKILNAFDQQLLQQGGFSFLSKICVSYIYMHNQKGEYRFNIEQLLSFQKQIDTMRRGLSDTNMSTFKTGFNKENIQVFNKILIKKKNKLKSKIDNEKRILKAIVKNQCVHLPKFYEDKSDTYKQYLFADFYIFKSLENYQFLNSKTLSKFTKIYILYQIIQGLRFLKSNSILHLDIKNSNILIGKNLIAKITDFGQAQKADYFLDRKRQQISFTPIFAPPEIFSINKQINHKADIFSFGVLMFQLLYGRSILQLRKSQYFTYENLVSNEIEYNKKLLFCIQRLYQEGNRIISTILSQLCFKCLCHRIDKRPQLNRLAIIMRLSIVYLDKIYC